MKVRIWREADGWHLGFTRHGLSCQVGPFYGRAFALCEARYRFGHDVEVDHDE